MPELEDVKIQANSYVEGKITLDDLSVWLAENFWDNEVPQLVHHAKHLIYDLEAELLDETELRSELGTAVGIGSAKLVGQPLGTATSNSSWVQRSHLRERWGGRASDSTHIRTA
jgi:hypothetical protein